MRFSGNVLGIRRALTGRPDLHPSFPISWPMHSPAPPPSLHAPLDPARRGRLRRPAAWLTVALGLSLAACGGGSDKGAGAGTGNGTGTGSGQVSSSADVNFLAAYLRDWYLWYREMPSFNAAGFTTPESLLQAARVRQDWYSYIDQASTFNAYYDEGRAIGYGFGYNYDRSSGNMYIRYVQPLSSSAASGLARGDRVTAINGQTIAALAAGTTGDNDPARAANRIDAALGASVEGLQATLTIERAGAPLTLPVMTKGWYTLRSVVAEQLIDLGDRKVGYLVFTSFTNPASGEWSNALASLIAEGATDLIVDLRENGGGRLAVAASVGSSLAPAGSSGRVETTLQFNDRHSGSNQTYYFQDTPNTGKIDRIVWITSPRTCSASESMMVALRPLRTSVSVGETTCGKPVGFSPPEYNGKVYNVVTFKLANSVGYSDYYSGLAPDCAVGEDWSRPFGDPAEPKLAAALNWLSTGHCSPTAAAARVQRSAALPDVREIPTGHGIEKLTGLR